MAFRDEKANFGQNKGFRNFEHDLYVIKNSHKLDFSYFLVQNYIHFTMRNCRFKHKNPRKILLYNIFWINFLGGSHPSHDDYGKTIDNIEKRFFAFKCQLKKLSGEIIKLIWHQVHRIKPECNFLVGSNLDGPIFFS